MRHNIETEQDAIQLQEKVVASLEDKFEKYGYLDESTVKDTLLLNEVTTGDPKFYWEKDHSASVGIPQKDQFQEGELPYFTDDEETMGFDIDEDTGKIYYFGSKVRKPSDDIYKPLPGEVPGFMFEMPHPEDFNKMWKDFDNYPRKSDVAKAMGVTPRTITNYVSKYKTAGYQIADRDSLGRGREAKPTDKDAKDKADVFTGSGRTGRTRRVGNFPGEFYRDVTRIKKNARKSWLKSLKTDVKQWLARFRYNDKLFIKIFLFGYQLDMGGIIYELWYNPYDNTYVIYDQFANRQGRSYYTMTDAVGGFLNFVATEEPGIDPNKIDNQSQVMIKDTALGSVEAAHANQIKNAKETGNEKAIETLRKFHLNARQESIEMEDGFEEAIISEHYDYIGFKDSLDPDVLKESILNENSALTSMFSDIIKNEMIDAYDNTRVDKHVLQRRLFQKFRVGGDGKIEFPPPSSRSKTMRFIMKLRGKPQLEGTFVKGFSLQGGGGGIDLEIWYMRENPGENSERTYFQVYNLSGLKSEGTAPTLRGAYQIVMRKIGIKDKD